MKRGFAIAAVCLLAVFLLLRTEAGQLLTGNWSFTDYVREDDGTFFRLKMKLAYKGEAQEFGVVVACHVKVIGYKDGGSTYKAGLTPTVYGRRMSDGKGFIATISTVRMAVLNQPHLISRLNLAGDNLLRLQT